AAGFLGSSNTAGGVCTFGFVDVCWWRSDCDVSFRRAPLPRIRRPGTIEKRVLSGALPFPGLVAQGVRGVVFSVPSRILAGSQKPEADSSCFAELFAWPPYV